MTQETFAALGVMFTGLLAIALVAMGVGALVASLKEWLNEKRMSVESTTRLLETQTALMEANNSLNERVKALEEERGRSGDADCSGAETIRRQQERIAELERELESLQVVDWWADEHGDTHAIAANGHEVCHYVRGEHAEAVNKALAERDALIRDMHRECTACGYSCRTDNGECGIIQRIRELGIEVDG